MLETSRHIDDLLTLDFPEFEQVMYRQVDKTDPPPGSNIFLLGIYPRGFQQSQVNTDVEYGTNDAISGQAGRRRAPPT